LRLTTETKVNATEPNEEVKDKNNFAESEPESNQVKE